MRPRPKTDWLVLFTVIVSTVTGCLFGILVLEQPLQLNAQWNAVIAVLACMLSLIPPVSFLLLRRRLYVYGRIRATIARRKSVSMSFGMGGLVTILQWHPTGLLGRFVWIAAATTSSLLMVLVLREIARPRYLS